jgi:uncharacterized protein (TIGR03067 family)
MRSFLFILFFIPAFGFAQSKENIDGKWITIKMVINGADLPEAAIKNHQLIISDSSYIFTAESVDKGILKYTNDKLDIYGKEGVNTGKHFTALYKVENGLLTICYNLAGDKYPEDFETKGKPMYFLAVFKKEETKQ